MIATVLSVGSLVYKAVDAAGNAEFLLQKLGLNEDAAEFLGSSRGIDFVVAVSFIALVVSLLYQVNRATLHLKGTLPVEEIQWHETAAYDLTKRSGTRPPIKSQPEAEQIEATGSEPEPNLVCTSTAPRPAYFSGDILVEGMLEGSTSQSNLLVSVAEFSNEFTLSHEVADAEGISAEVVYQSSSGQQIKVKRGSWLNRDTYRLDFSVNDAHRLIIAFAAERSDDYLFMLTRERTNERDPFENRIALLNEDLYHIKVRLISEAARKLYKEFDFIFTIIRKPELAFELVEARELAPQEIRQQLETFLREGSDLLRDFPREGLAATDSAKVDDWEKRVVKFLGRCPAQFSTTLFLADFPEVSVAGHAHGTNWIYLKRLARRLATLREFIDELRRS